MNRENKLVAPISFGKPFGILFGVGVSSSNVIIPDSLDGVCLAYLEVYLSLNAVSIEDYNSKYKDDKEWSIEFYEWVANEMSKGSKRIERLLFDLHENGLQ